MNKAAYERGGIKHFYDYAIEQCQKSIKNAGIKEGKFSSIHLFPKKSKFWCYI